ncbi:MAG: hypothetical protein IPJ04_06260 [Candidatus Eisenbacteria bacterium]|nr:hypothetical protein [Candidatus Eisenbacteria bacterium]
MRAASAAAIAASFTAATVSGERAVERGGLVERVARGAERFARRRLALGEPLERGGSQRAQPVGVRETRGLLLQLFFLALGELRVVEFRGGRAQVVAPLGERRE